MRQMLQQNRRWMAEALHATVAASALAMSFLLRFEFALDPQHRALLWGALPLTLAAKIGVFRYFELQHLAWRYLGFADLQKIALANAAASAVSIVAIRLVCGPSFPRSVYGIDFVVCLTLFIAARAVMKLLLERGGSPPVKAPRRILIYGAGQAGVTLLSEIRADCAVGLHVAGFIDDDPAKRDMQVHGAKVLGGRSDIAQVVRRLGIGQVLIALPRIDASTLTSILETCHAAGVEARRIPALAELIENRVLVEQIREVRLEDLLGRPPVRLQEDQVRARIAGRVILITGAGGSIGSELCRQIARFGPGAIVGLDHAETPLYHIEQELQKTRPGVAFWPEIGSIQNRRRLDEVFRAHHPQTVFHTAAYKHVPMMESHLFEAVENNVLGTETIAQCASANGVENFVLVSSDKAVRPTNVMGATKRLAEMVCLARPDSGVRTRFMAVRFGNVLGSSGSVIPKFQRQIAEGGPVTVTHPEMRRFFMTIPEASQLVLQAAAMGQGGEIFVLEMGAPVKIVDLARKMVLLSGLRPDHDIQIVYSGIRPGEKLYEELSALEEETMATCHAQIRIVTGRRAVPAELQRTLRELRRATEERDPAGALMCLKETVADYKPSNTVLCRALQERARSVVA
jgi:FlaA1/EpsC-like NDP-sugar epimerase